MFEGLLKILTEFWNVLGEMSPYLLFGFFVAGVLSVLISPKLVEKHLGKSGTKDVFKASLLGVPLPLCSCGVIPVAASLKRSGASNGATTSFLISTPQTGIDSIAVTYGLLGPIFTVVKVVVAFIGGIIGGLLVNAFAKDGGTSFEEQSGNAQNPGYNNSNNEENGLQPKKLSDIIIQILKYGFITIPKDIGKALLVGLIIAGLISVLLPKDFFAGVFGSGIIAMLVVLAFSIPLYVCSTASVPVAAALMLKGLSPGAALVLLIAGPATNAATISTVWKVLGKKVAGIYLITMAITAIGAGLLLDLLPIKLFESYLVEHHEMGMHTVLNNICAVILLSVLLFSYFNPGKSSKTEKEDIRDNSLIFNIKGMSCDHCVQSIKGALSNVEGVSSTSVNLSSGKTIVNGEGLDPERIYKTVEKLGYEVEKAKVECSKESGCSCKD